MNATHPSTAADSLPDRRGFIGSTVTLALSACGSDEPTSTGSAAVSDDFPVTVNGAFGPTTLPTRPERVVAVGTRRIRSARDVHPAFAGLDDVVPPPAKMLAA